MNRNAILGGVLLVLLAAIFLPKVLPEKKNYPDLLAQVDSAAVDYIRLEQGGEAITLEKSGESWVLSEPLRFDADPAAVGRLLQGLQEIRVIARTSDNSGYEQDRRFELDDDQARRVTLRQGAETVLDARIGKASSDFSNGFARLEGEEPIYRTAQHLAGRIQTRQSGWIKRQLLDHDGNTLSSLSLNHADGSRMDFANRDSLWTLTATDRRGRVTIEEREASESLLSSIRNTAARFRISDIGADSLVAKVDAEQPDVVLSYTTAGGEEETIRWYRPDPESSKILCRVEGYEPWFETFKSNLDRLEKDPEEFLQKDD